ncbi:MAG: FMN-binding protein [bacterium]|nr:FMN-binding protein [bacterium]
MKKVRIGLVIGIVIVSIILIAGIIGGSLLSKEHEEARNITLNNSIFLRLSDGKYIGRYEGGMYKWRSNNVEVDIVSGKLISVNLLDSKELESDDSGYINLIKRVIKNQSLDVNVISGATLTSRAHLMAIENALQNSVNLK